MHTHNKVNTHNINTWKYDLKKGEEAENIFLNIYGRKNFIDVRQEEYYQKIDVDFLNKHNEEKIEVKGNFSKIHDNLFLETISSTNINSSGWWEHTEADKLFYIFIHRKFAINISIPLLKMAVDELKPPIRYGKKEKGNSGCGKCLNVYLLIEWMLNMGYKEETFLIKY